MAHNALGLIETRGLVGAIEATDAALKAGTVRIASRESAGSGYVTVIIEGELGEVQAAIKAADQAAHLVGQYVASKVIPRPSVEVTDMLLKRKADARPTRSAKAERKAEPGAKAARPAASKPKPVPEAEPQAAPQPEPIAQTVEPPPSIDWAELQALPVVKLRQFARTIDGLPIQGRQISMANKDQLLDAIRAAIS